MFLIGQFDSPFVRRVAIALRLYGVAFAHKPWSTFGDADLIAPYNPLRRVPTLVLDDGEALIDSHMILDYLDELAGPDRAMLPPKASSSFGDYFEKVKSNRIRPKKRRMNLRKFLCRCCPKSYLQSIGIPVQRHWTRI